MALILDKGAEEEELLMSQKTQRRCLLPPVVVVQLPTINVQEDLEERSVTGPEGTALHLLKAVAVRPLMGLATDQDFPPMEMGALS